MNQARLESPRAGFPTTTKRYPASSPDVLEVVLRRDREVVTFVLVTVITACWLYLLAGAGTGMYPHEMAELVHLDGRRALVGRGVCAGGLRRLVGGLLHRGVSIHVFLHSSSGCCLILARPAPG